MLNANSQLRSNKCLFEKLHYYFNCWARKSLILILILDGIDVQKDIITIFFVSAITMYSTLVLLPSKHLIACLDYSPLCLIVYLGTKNLNDHKEHNVYK